MECVDITKRLDFISGDALLGFYSNCLQLLFVLQIFSLQKSEVHIL